MKVNIPNTKLNVYKIVLQEVCQKFSGAKEYEELRVKKRIEELCNEKKIVSRKDKLFVYE